MTSLAPHAFPNATLALRYNDANDGDFGVECLKLGAEEFSYALGKGGSTRKKLAKASGCILEYIGETAFMAGSKAERGRARDYLTWLLQQRTGSVNATAEGRDDVLVMPVPSETVGFLTGSKGQSLRQVEHESGTFCFADTSGGEHLAENILIFSCKESRRRNAEVRLQTG